MAGNAFGQVYFGQNFAADYTASTSASFTVTAGMAGAPVDIKTIAATTATAIASLTSSLLAVEPVTMTQVASGTLTGASVSVEPITTTQVASGTLGVSWFRTEQISSTLTAIGEQSSTLIDSKFIGSIGFTAQSNMTVGLINISLLTASNSATSALTVSIFRYAYQSGTMSAIGNMLTFFIVPVILDGISATELFIRGETDTIILIEQADTPMRMR